MGELTELFNTQLRFPLLSKLAKACHERIFCILKKIQTDNRSELSNNTICLLICAKQNQDVACYDYTPSD